MDGQIHLIDEAIRTQQIRDVYFRSFLGSSVDNKANESVTVIVVEVVIITSGLVTTRRRTIGTHSTQSGCGVTLAI